MTDVNHSQATSMPPDAQLIQMSTAYWVSCIVYAAAKLDLADRLAEGAKSAADLAGPMGVHARSLHRLMRTLASLGVLTQQGEQRFALTPMGEALRSDVPGAARATVLTLCDPQFARSLMDLAYSVQTGEPAFNKQNGVPIFQFLAQHPEAASLFSQTMVGFHGAEPAAVAEAYDFSSFGTIVSWRHDGQHAGSDPEAPCATARAAL